MKLRNKFLAILLALVLMFSMAAPAWATDGNTLHIGSVDDLMDFSRKCALDSWSRDKTVYLDNDLDLSGVEFDPIPTFGGTFYGNGHTIRGLDLQESGGVRGLFRYVQAGGTVQNLKVEGVVSPADSGATVGGIVGSNSGKLVGCSFQGSVAGEENVGGLAGVNEADGQIINCVFSGTVTGKHYVGGVVGQNLGSVVQSRNNGSINTTQIESEADLSAVDWEQINSLSNIPVCTDVGGIAGYSTGVIQGCQNSGDVGYPHMGYNIGGIVGRQCGYLDGCTNEGSVLGRKDVGGIAGQLEPELTLQYSADILDQLGTELDTLQALVDGTLTDVGSASDSLFAQMKSLSASAKSVKASTSSLAEALVDVANSGIDTINDISARISWALDQIDPIVDTGKESLILLEAAVGQFADAWESSEPAAELTTEAIGDIRLALEDLQRVIRSGRDAYSNIKTGMEHLRNSLGDEAAVSSALREIADGISDLQEAFASNAEALETIRSAIEQGQSDPAWQDLLTALRDFQAAIEEISGALKDILSVFRSLAQDGVTQENLSPLGSAAGSLLTAGQRIKEASANLSAAVKDMNQGQSSSQNLTDLQNSLDSLTAACNSIQDAESNLQDNLQTWNNYEEALPHLTQLNEAVRRLTQGIADANTALDAISAALDALSASGISNESIAQMQEAVRSIQENLRTMLNAANRIQAALKTLGGNFDAAEFESAIQSLKAAAEDADAAMASLSSAIGHINDALAKIEAMGDAAGGMRDDLSQALDSLDSALALLPQIAEDVQTVLSDLSEKPSISFDRLDSSITQKSDALGTAMSDLLNSADSLGQSVSSSAGSLTSDMEAISREIGVITQLLQDGIAEQKDASLSDLYEDISDQEDANAQDSGKISNANNIGVVEGDVNVAGIVGSMALEVDFDPEDDLIQSGDRSLNFSYLAKAVVQSCSNSGAVTGKKDYAGGIVGRMDLGRVSSCQSYGAVSSASGGYVGGIAGASYSVIRSSWAKCRLSGGSYVGGIAGWGGTIQDCHALVSLDSDSPNAGSIAGYAEDLSVLSGNTFVSQSLAAVDGISYSGKAEPVDYDVLLATDGVPKNFDQFALTFTAEGETVAVISFQYGGSITELPEVPAKPGYSGQWPTIDYTSLTFSQTLEAEYTPYASALSAESGLPQILVDGSFSADAEISQTEAAVSWESGGTSYSGTAYTVTVQDPTLGEVPCTVHFRLPDVEQKYTLWVQTADGWERRDYEVDGSYLLFPSQGSATFCLEANSSHIWLWIIIAAVAALAVAVLMLWQLRKRKKNRCKVKT